MNIVEFQADIVEAMLEWMYKGTYTNPKFDDGTDTATVECCLFTRHVHVNAIANYYDIEGLSLLSNINLKDAMNAARSVDNFPVAIREAFNVIGDKHLQIYPRME